MAKSEGSFLGSIVRSIVRTVVGMIMIIALIIGANVYMAGQGVQMAADQDRFETLYGNYESKNLLLNIGVEGMILGTPPDALPSGPFGLMNTGAATYGYAVKNMLGMAAQNPDIKGVLLHVISPGGTIFGSMAIHDAVKDYQARTGNPVVAYVEGMSASGGVMAMAGADAIYADMGSLVGSIGVAGSTVLYYNKPKAIDGGLLGGGITTEGGIEQTIISAGRSKDLGNPFRRMTAEERAVLQEGVDELYMDFVKHVASNREIAPEVIINEMGAQIYENRQAQKYGLIDGTRSWDQAVGELALLAKADGDFRLVQPQRPRMSALERLFMVSADQGSETDIEKLDRMVRSDMCTAISHQALVYFGPTASLCQ